jgi:hypothetical protein
MEKNSADRLSLKSIIFGGAKDRFKISRFDRYDVIMLVSIAVVFIILNESTEDVFKYSHLALAILVYFIAKIIYLSSLKMRKS